MHCAAESPAITKATADEPKSGKNTVAGDDGDESATVHGTRTEDRVTSGSIADRSDATESATVGLIDVEESAITDTVVDEPDVAETSVVMSSIAEEHVLDKTTVDCGGLGESVAMRELRKKILFK